MRLPLSFFEIPRRDPAGELRFEAPGGETGYQVSSISFTSAAIRSG